MRLFISNFKAFFIALSIIILIECILFFCHRGVTDLHSNILSFAFHDEATGQRILVNDKIDKLGKIQTDFIQVGDSSGLFGVEPNIIMSHLKGLKYVSHSCCADTGWDGYLDIAKNILAHDKKAKYLVLHITPYSFPLQYKEGFSNILYEALASPWHYIYDFLPSMSFRSDVTNAVYYGKFQHKLLSEGELSEKWKNKLVSTSGWVPIEGKDTTDRPRGDCDFPNFFDEQGKSTVYQKLRKFKKLSDAHHVKLILLFNPVSCHDSKKIAPISADFKRFATRYPDVYIPFPLVTTYHVNYFHDRWHLNAKGAKIHSHEIGNALVKLINA